MRLKTPYSETMDKSHPLDGHPDPYWRRDNFINLNGPWDFVMTQSKALPEKYPEQIIVPFAIETELSGIHRPVSAKDYLHYRKEVEVPDLFVGGSALLRFMAVDQEADIYIDGELFCSHKGGYVPFSVYIDVVKKRFILEVVVHDDTANSNYARGKQSLQPGGIWYTPTSGIWQSVYLEFVPAEGYFEQCRIQGDFDGRNLIFDGVFAKEKHHPKVTVYFRGKFVGESFFDEHGHALVDVSENFHPWASDEPNLYDLVFEDGKDVVHSVTGIRKIENVQLGNKHYLLINNRPTFLNALLDQGYWPESGLTPPSVEAMQSDILFAKSCGFNCLRKHIKIEPRRWYYLCDMLGVYVMQDMVNGGDRYSPHLIRLAPFLPIQVSDKGSVLGRGSLESREQFKRELRDSVSTLYNIPSIVVWTLFNEGWGQFLTKEMFQVLRSYDATRLIDATSGWFDKKVGDFRSRHIYFRPIHLINDHQRILSLSEYGGYSMHLKEHSWSRKEFGYKKFKDKVKFSNALSSLFRKQVGRGIKKHALSIAVYTQLSDVEEEVNGLITYDRRIVKINQAELFAINRQLLSEYKMVYTKAWNQKR